MTKALFLYTKASGSGKILQEIDGIKEELSLCFDTLDSHLLDGVEDGMKRAKEACGKYDVLIISGGDGTFFHIINAIVNEKEIPTIGYINGGTICDVGKNFGIAGNYKKALKIIKQGFTCTYDLVDCNGTAFNYMAAVGAYSDIAYATPRYLVKRHGRLSYYFRAVTQAFRRTRIHAHVEVDGKAFDCKTPFVLLLNGKNVGGFCVNPRSSMHDGKVELLLAKPGLFNGLLHYFFHVGVTKISATEMKIKTDANQAWCMDGEETFAGELNVKVLQNRIRIFCAKRYSK